MDVRSLLIDNYDSFTYNLSHLIAKVQGVEPIVVQNDDPLLASLDFKQFDMVLLSPGPGHPAKGRDFGGCVPVLTAGVPILGVCLGHQGICHFGGGRVERAREPMHGRLSQIHHGGQGLFQGLPSPFEAVRYHSLVVTEVPADMEVTARTADDVVMAVAYRDQPIFGVQFHPESICTEHGERLIENFGRIAAAAWTPAQAKRPPRLRSQSARACPPLEGGVQRYRVAFRRLTFAIDPEQVYVGAFAESELSFWLDGSVDADSSSGFSYMGDGSGPHSAFVTHDVGEGLTEVRQGQTTHQLQTPLLDYLDQELARRRVSSASLPFEFNLGYVGYLGYELKAECGAANVHSASTPDAALLFADRLVAFDHERGDVYLLCLVDANGSIEEEEWLPAMETRLRQIQIGASANGVRSAASREVDEPTVCRHGAGEYISLIRECKREISAGESYEICLTNQTAIKTRIDPLEVYKELRRANPAPYAALLRFPEVAVISSSPERFLVVTESGEAESKPIKGTAPRGRTRAEDEENRSQLGSSEKDRAENLMIVDLVRNDLSRVCEAGTVEVAKLFDVESFATVHQLVSTVRGQLRSDLSAIDCVRAAFPGGSMTGAPKLRSMEIIDRLEGGPRGVYSGALGWFGLGGALDLGMVIRTIVATEDEVSYGSGGAIVALSDPVLELDEMRLKGDALSSALQASPRAVKASAT
jgi:para-aminobenzoate synthetase